MNEELIKEDFDEEEEELDINQKIKIARDFYKK